MSPAAAPALGSAGARLHPPRLGPASAPPLGTFRRADAPRGPRAAPRLPALSARRAVRSAAPAAPPGGPGNRQRVLWGQKPLSSAATPVPPQPPHAPQRGPADPRRAATGLAPRRLWPAAPARGNPGRSRAPRPPFRVGRPVEPAPRRGKRNRNQTAERPRAAARRSAGGPGNTSHAPSRLRRDVLPEAARPSGAAGAGRCPRSEVGLGALPGAQA